MANPLTRRVTAAAVAFFVVLSLLLSVCCIACEAGHACAGEGCEICTRIAACARRLVCAVTVASAAAAAFAAVRRARPAGTRPAPVRTATPVALRVKLSA